jgi:uncharacterized phosphosugar-binding protein
MTAAATYAGHVLDMLNAIVGEEMPVILDAARVCHDAVAKGGLIYIFGTGHSHMLAEEGHYRAGGLAAVVPVLASALMLHEGAAASTKLERASGIASAILSRYDIGAADALIVASNSGVNAVPVEAAVTAKAQGAKVIAIVSRAYAAAATAGSAGRLTDIADLVIDNKGPPGDATVELGGGLRGGPSSTVAGAFILNALLIETAALLGQDGMAPVYVSANMPGSAGHNLRLVQQYRSRNPHL